MRMDHNMTDTKERLINWLPVLSATELVNNAVSFQAIVDRCTYMAPICKATSSPASKCIAMAGMPRFFFAGASALLHSIPRARMIPPCALMW